MNSFLIEIKVSLVILPGADGLPGGKTMVVQKVGETFKILGEFLGK
jgi:hypothetical protein